MQQWEQFKKPEGIGKVIDSINEMYERPIKIMEICGTHTMSIAKAGLKSLLHPNIKLISGPGCPVCVTPQDRIDSILQLAKDKSIIIATYGDMLRVPGTNYGESLLTSKAIGASVEIVYSAMDAIELADKYRDKEIVFLGIGFETTTPSSAVALKTARENKLNNFSIFSMHKLCEPALRTIIEQKDFDIDGFICPGNVSIILGETGFEFLSQDYRLPAVISGFEGGDLVTSIYKIVEMIIKREAKLLNEYSRLVTKNGNMLAKEITKEYFEPCDDLWRGIGSIKNSGLKIKSKYKEYDTVSKFGITLGHENYETSCSCGDIIMGKQDPAFCTLFGKACTPDNPIGPCMVSSEGACAAKYKYGS